MNQKVNSLPKEVTKVILGLPILLSLVVGIAGITPQGRGKDIFYNFTAVYINAGLALVLISARVVELVNKHRNNPKTAWVGRYLVQITGLPVIAGVTALNFVYASLPSWHWIIPLALMYPVAALLPFVNENLSEKLHDEAYTPKTRFGQIVVFSLLAIAPIAGIFGAFLSGISERSGNGVSGYSIMGLVLHFIFIWAETTMAHTAWEERPGRRKRRKRRK